MTRLLEHPLVGAEALDRLHTGGPVLIAGVGNLGHRMALGLAPLKVPLWLVDHGRVEQANVGLQLFCSSEVGGNKVDVVRRRLLEMDPLLPVRNFVGDIRGFDLGDLRRCRLVIGCLDSLSDRLWLMQTTMHLGVPYLDAALDGSGKSLYGRVSSFDAACLACGWDDSNWDDVSTETARAACEALWNRPGEAAPTLALPGLSDMVAGLGVVQATRLLLGLETNRVLGREVRINMTTGKLTESSLKPDARCRLDHCRWNIDHVIQSTRQTKVGKLLDLAYVELGGEARVSVHDDALVLGVACPTCRRQSATCRLRSQLAGCSECGTQVIPLTDRLREWFGRDDIAAYLERTWEDLGLTPGRVLRARGRNGEKAFLFSV